MCSDNLVQFIDHINELGLNYLCFIKINLISCQPLEVGAVFIWSDVLIETL
jgi:hypothetical protein